MISFVKYICKNMKELFYFSNLISGSLDFEVWKLGKKFKNAGPQAVGDCLVTVFCISFISVSHILD